MADNSTLKPKDEWKEHEESFLEVEKLLAAGDREAAYKRYADELEYEWECGGAMQEAASELVPRGASDAAATLLHSVMKTARA